MDEKQALESPARRAFFRKAGVGVGAAGVLAVGLSGGSSKAQEITKMYLKKSAYRETEHVKKFYKSARLLESIKSDDSL